MMQFAATHMAKAELMQRSRTRRMVEKRRRAAPATSAVWGCGRFKREDTSPNFGDMFNCDGDNSQSKGQGLFDASSANEYANCDTFGWKHSLGGEDPEEYWSSSCDAIGGARDSRCSRGGKCVDSSCCATHFVSNSRGCGFLNMGCQPKCRLIKNQVNYCGSSFPAENSCK